MDGVRSGSIFQIWHHLQYLDQYILYIDLVILLLRSTANLILESLKFQDSPLNIQPVRQSQEHKAPLLARLALPGLSWMISGIFFRIVLGNTESGVKEYQSLKSQPEPRHPVVTDYPAQTGRKICSLYRKLKQSLPCITFDAIIHQFRESLQPLEVIAGCLNCVATIPNASMPEVVKRIVCAQVPASTATLLFLKIDIQVSSLMEIWEDWASLDMWSNLPLSHARVGTLVMTPCVMRSTLLDIW